MQPEVPSRQLKKQRVDHGRHVRVGLFADQDLEALKGGLVDRRFATKHRDNPNLVGL